MASGAKKIYIMVHLFSSSARGCTELFPVPRQTTSRLALLICFSESERSFDMQARAMPLMGIARPPCFVGARAAAIIFLHTKKHDSLYLRTCHLAERCTLLQPHKTLGFQFFSILIVFLCMRDLSWSLIASTHSALQKSSSKCHFQSCVTPPTLSAIFCKVSGVPSTNYISFQDLRTFILYPSAVLWIDSWIGGLSWVPTQLCGGCLRPQRGVPKGIGSLIRRGVTGILIIPTHLHPRIKFCCQLESFWYTCIKKMPGACITYIRGFLWTLDYWKAQPWSLIHVTLCAHNTLCYCTWPIKKQKWNNILLCKG